MGQHAYMIICHNNFRILQKLVNLLDDSRNDIYIHVDRKVKYFEEWKTKIYTKRASLTFTERANVAWGGSSQIKAELILLDAATRSNHDYYHLLSGVDMPLMHQGDIHSFFEANHGKEFIGIDDYSFDGMFFSDRIQCYHFLQDIIGRNSGPLCTFLRHLESASLQFQNRLKVNRIQHIHTPIYKGPQWFSITHAMAKYILDQKARIKKHFNFGLGVDELFLQTIAMGSPYADNIVNDTLRYIDWKRGSPYTFHSDDFDELMNSGKLFARKFDENTDMAIVDRIYTELSKNDRRNELR